MRNLVIIMIGFAVMGTMFAARHDMENVDGAVSFEEHDASLETEGKDAWAVARAEAKQKKSGGSWSNGDTFGHRSGDSASRPSARNASMSSGPVKFDRGAGGHFYANANIRGSTIRFLVDTGATGVALTEADARKIGLHFSPSEYRVVGRQVSGLVRGKNVTLDSITVGSKTVRNVDAVIIQGGTMSLLGQSFLTRAGKLEMDGDTMILH
ncbi:retropepsin-like aspartic protease family protein [Sphingomicrobium sediminis]|uniref:TIGR02281 family clan AA aspartic protease n=1 Tax=Sphingomicrobium sediminis TaxID=2950949 RepID=A0A9X2EHL3_9SPHN|nr:TIGR02281 family clan AA aspartic protease [Sphingomicrobium sediminis]MCM8558183.1 TIGR02281 family clan AA aspartic protease [Sphingomicrobium sediminis]